MYSTIVFFVVMALTVFVFAIDIRQKRSQL